MYFVLLTQTKYILYANLASQGETLQGKQPSSYPDYLNIRKTEWVNPEEVLAYFSKSNGHLSYKSFVQQDEDFDSIQTLLLEEE